MTPLPCRSCYAEGPCLPGCECAKCVDPEAYDEWRYNNPQQYLGWLRRNGFDTECPGCGYERGFNCNCWDVSWGTP